MLLLYNTDVYKQAFLRPFNTLCAVINLAASSPITELNVCVCACAHYKRYVVINFNSGFVTNCAFLQLKLLLLCALCHLSGAWLKEGNFRVPHLSGARRAK